MKALALFAALATAHITMLAGHSVPLSTWTPFAYLWQDAAVALLFAALDRITRQSLAMWVLYALLVAYAAVNVAVARVLPGPLTPAMFHAAGGALSDSIALHVTLANVLACLPTLVIAVLAPLALRRWQPRGRTGVILASIALCIAAIGPVAAQRIATNGRDRNAFGALVPVRLPAAPANAIADLRTSPFGHVNSVDLSKLRGIAQRRNVVVVILESTGARYLQPYGAEQDPMPNLTRLSRDALLFDAAYSVYPESIKGLFSVICSRYPAPDVPVEALAGAHCDSLATRYAASGYRTALFHSGRFSYLGMQGLLEGKGFDVLTDAATLTGRVNSSFGIDEPTTVQAMLSWLDTVKSDEPFFLMYLPAAGHHPYATTAPGPFPPVDERHRYLNAIHEADAALGQLLDGIAQRGLSDNTMFVVFGDHAEAFDQHPGNMAHSFYLYEENVRVPFIVAAPGLWQGTKVARPISLVDAAPTMLDLGGIDLPVRAADAIALHGQSALTASSDMVFFYTDYAAHLLGLYDQCWKYHHDVGSGRSELYQICTDPAESINLANRESGRVSAYKEKVRAWAGAARAAIMSGE